jgi:hypothetical protein
MRANLLILLNRILIAFSKNVLKLLNNQADFDSAIRRFDPSRPSQLILLAKSPSPLLHLERADSADRWKRRYFCSPPFTHNIFQKLEISNRTRDFRTTTARVPEDKLPTCWIVRRTRDGRTLRKDRANCHRPDIQLVSHFIGVN